MYKQKIKMEVNKPYLLPVTMKQSDTGRVLNITLKDNGATYDLNGKVIKLYGRKSDSTIVFKATEIIDYDNGIVNINFTNQMLAKEGDLLLELVILNSDEKLISTIPFIVTVIKSVRDKESDSTIVEESQNDITAFEEALAEITGYETDMANFKADVNSNIDTKFSEFQDKWATSYQSLVTSVMKKMRTFYNEMYPVGEIIEFATPTNPKNLYGGEWVEIGVGCTTVGVGTHTDLNGNTKEFKNGHEYGTYDYKLTQKDSPYMPSGNEVTGYGLSSDGGDGFANRASVTKIASEQSSFSLMQPSIGVYRWRRTALATVEESDILLELATAIKSLGINTSAIQDGAITKPKLSTELQTSIDKIDKVEANNSQLMNQFKDIQASAGNDNTEIVSARTDSFSNTYTTLSDRLFRYDKGILTYNDIATLKADTKLKEGQIVYVRGYYGDDLSSHHRVISSTNNGGFGELLDNGLYANLLHNNSEINITHIGARNSYNSNYKIYDIVPYLTKVFSSGLIAFIPSGWWALSSANFAKHSIKIKGCNLQPFFNGENYTDKVASTVLFPCTEGQDSVLHIGNKYKECRGIELRGFQVVTNSMYYNSSNEFVPNYDTGAKIGIDLETITVFSKLEDIIMTGTNTNVEYGIKFNGCETFFKGVKFRRFAPIGSNAKYAFYSYHRAEDTTNNIIAMTVSGLTYEGMDFEGVGCPHANFVGVDVHFTDSCNEFGFLKVKNGHSYELVDYSSIPSDATVNYKGVFNISNVEGIIFDQISFQKLGSCYKHFYTNENGVDVIEYDVWDSLFTQSTDYLNSVMFSYNNIILQESKKEINVVNFPDNLGYRDVPNKGVVGVGTVLADKQAKIILRDNMGVQLPEYRNTSVRSANALSLSNYQTSFMNTKIYPNYSALQHGIRWDNDWQREYFSRIIGSNTYTEPYANYLALFNIDEYLIAGENTLLFWYKNKLRTAITMDVVFVKKDGTTITETISFPGTNNNATKLLKHTFTVANDTRVQEIRFNNCSDNNLRIYELEHRI